MKVIHTIKEQDINPSAPNVDRTAFRQRHAVRAVVLDDQGRVALLHATVHNYHKLPGGGIDDGEDKIAALERELMEEIGCKATITGEIGEVHEFRDQWQLFQTSYCYLAKLSGEQLAPSFTDEEIAEDFEAVWARDIDEAIAILAAEPVKHYDSHFMTRRDLHVLQSARRMINVG